MKVDVIIPVYKPDASLFKLMDSLKAQTVPVHNIILMNTEEKYFQQLVAGIDFHKSYPNVKVYHLSKKEFDHGGTRRRGVRKSDAEVFLMMTQDAMPGDEHLIEYLLQGLGKENVAVAYARQLPREDCRPIERYLRQFNYPETSGIKSAEDLKDLGIKTYFCSNVCCAYRRDIYEKLGGFIRHTIFNEDMIYAASVIKAGYRIAYMAEAEVIHSHNYTCKQQLHRNFDLGVSQAKHPEVFEGVPSEGEGIRSVKATARYLHKQHLTMQIPYLVLQSASKYMGYLLGKHYRLLPARLVYALSMNKDYWRRTERRKAS
ncbi:MAG: glycosyltransferase family 2 protein [Lachnospiraceae bacterium]|nr:glycosyltransferase family 2 protein [Lachnospiraceae bacterium]